MSERSSADELDYWWALVAALGDEETQAQLTTLMADRVDEAGLPAVLLDPRSSVGDVLRAAPNFDEQPTLPDSKSNAEAAERLMLLKASVNVFGQQLGEQVSAEQYSQWLADVREFETAFGYQPGQLLQGRGGTTGRGIGTGGGSAATDQDVADAIEQIDKGQGLMSEPEIQAGLQSVEKSMIDRMALADILKDKKLAAEITPSMAMISQLLRQKGGLSGVALANAKSIIRRYIDELQQILARQVESTKAGRVDHSVPPRRVFSNLDLKRTLWQNLVNYDPEDERLYVDRLYYKHTAKLVQKHRMIVVVDQSGSMVPAMVNCTILASIFAGLPAVSGHLIAYDTQAIDLSEWIDDPFEVLLRTQLGGGTNGICVLPHLVETITDPRKTVVVWISDFYDNRELMPAFRNLVHSGVTFLPVGSVSTSGYFSVDGWFRKELKDLGTPIMSGSLKTLIRELKTALP